MSAKILALVHLPLAIAASFMAVLAPATTTLADDVVLANVVAGNVITEGAFKEIPESHRGTWVLRLTSDDGGKSYKSGDGMPICEITAKGIKFTKKVAYSDENLVVKSVTKREAAGKATYSVTFENGKVWLLDQNGPSLTAILQDASGEKLTETYRIVMRKR